MPQLKRSCMSQLKISRATTKTWHSQINEWMNKFFLKLLYYWHSNWHTNLMFVFFPYYTIGYYNKKLPSQSLKLFFVFYFFSYWLFFEGPGQKLGRNVTYWCATKIIFPRKYEKVSLSEHKLQFRGKEVSIQGNKCQVWGWDEARNVRTNNTIRKLCEKVRKQWREWDKVSGSEIAQWTMSKCYLPWCFKPGMGLNGRATASKKRKRVYGDPRLVVFSSQAFT